MGCGNSDTQTSTWNDQTQTTSLANVSPEEEAQRKALEGLGTNQLGALNTANNFAQTGDYLKLSPEDQAQLDAAYNASRLRMQIQGQQYADFLAGGRGMRMSDTPVAQQALNQYGLGLADLESQRANAGLNLGFQTNMARQADRFNFSSALPSGTVYGHTALMNNRLAQPTTHIQGTGNTMMYNNPSLLTQMQQGAAAYKDIGAGTNQFMQAAGGGKSMGMF